MFFKSRFPSEPLSDLSASSIFGNPSFSLEIMISLFVLSLSLIVRIIRSTSPFPRWSLTGHTGCSIKFFVQKWLNFSLLKTVPGSVRILFGIQFATIYSDKNSITFSVMGCGKNSASGHDECLSTDTSKYFIFWFAFWKSPAKSQWLHTSLF